MFKYLLSIAILFSLLPTSANIIKHATSAPNYGGYHPRPKIINSRPTNHCIQRGPHNYWPKNNFNQKSYIPRNNLSALERYSLNKSYARQNDIKRLERLETLAFGSIQQGDLYSRYHNVENAILSRPKPIKKHSIMNNLTNYLVGQSTGFTPSILLHDNYYSSYPNNLQYVPSSGFTTNTFQQYSNGIFGGGWNMSGNNYGANSSVKILD